MGAKYDFSGWATKNDLKCSDGRTIRRDAFKVNDGETVPLVWAHQHNDPSNILGHALLENRPEGVYFYGAFNETEPGRNARSLVEHGDIRKVSIWANDLQQTSNGDVLHGVIRELSLVLAGANPGATIEFPILAHGVEAEDRAVISTGEDFELFHADSQEEKPKEEESKDALEKKGESQQKEDTEDEETVADVFDTLSEKQKKAVYYIVNQAIQDEKSDSDKKDDEAKHSDMEGEAMKHNVFDNEATKSATLSHDDMAQIFKDAKRIGSLRDAVLENMESGVLSHAVYNHDSDGNQTTQQTYGIADINYLFPDAKTITNTPDFISREMDWVKKVMNGTHHTPFSRVKSIHANITMDEARAKGYIKGNRKVEEVFSLLKRTTDPQTIYKKQKLDRDDIIDITDFDVVAWLKSEMRLMLDEEIARAILIGDGRSASSDDKISELHIRPIVTDADLYNVKSVVTAGADDAATAKNFIRAAIKSRKDYKGSGNPVLFTTEDWLTEMLLLEDEIGHMLYESEAQLATKLRVREIVTVPAMEGLTTSLKIGDATTASNYDVLGIIVNLQDYNVGADKGGAVSMFDDFDIDYNQQKYLIETRISGALTKPYSAITLVKAQ